VIETLNKQLSLLIAIIYR